MTKRSWTIAVVVVGACLAASSAWAQGLGGGGFGGGGGGFGGQGGANRTPGANTTSIGANMNSAGNLPLITSRQTQGVFGARTLSSPHQQRYRAMMGRSQAGSGAGQYANSGQFRQRGSSSSTSGLGSFSSFSGGMGGQMQANPNAATKRRRNAGAAGTLKPGALQLGFRPPAPIKTQLMATLEQRLGRVLEQSSLTVQLEGRTAVLQGSVASERDRDLAAQLVLLEPGISAVRNEISTPDSPPADLPLSPPQEQSPTSPPDDLPAEASPDQAQSSEPAAR